MHRGAGQEQLHGRCTDAIDELPAETAGIDPSYPHPDQRIGGVAELLACHLAQLILRTELQIEVVAGAPAGLILDRAESGIRLRGSSADDLDLFRWMRNTRRARRERFNMPGLVATPRGTAVRGECNTRNQNRRNQVTASAVQTTGSKRSRRADPAPAPIGYSRRTWTGVSCPFGPWLKTATASSTPPTTKTRGGSPPREPALALMFPVPMRPLTPPTPFSTDEGVPSLPSFAGSRG